MTRKLIYRKNFNNLVKYDYSYLYLNYYYFTNKQHGYMKSKSFSCKLDKLNRKHLDRLSCLNFILMLVNLLITYNIYFEIFLDYYIICLFD